MANPLTEQSATWKYVGQHTFGSFLKRHRMALGLSRRTLSVISGIQERQLESIELNKAVPSYEHIRSLALALRLPEQMLLEAAGCLRTEQG